MEKENEKLKNLFNKKMLNLIDDILFKLNYIMFNQLQYINNKVKFKFDLLNQTNIFNEFVSNCKNLIDELRNNKLTYYSSLNISLDFNFIIQEKKSILNFKINEIAENLQKEYYYLFCYENNILNISCPNSEINKMNEFEKYSFQISKIKGTFNYLTLFQSYVNNIINDDNLNNLSVENFVNLYKNLENFNEINIYEEIENFLDNLKMEGKKNIQSNINSLKEIIKNNFIYGFNLSEIVLENLYKNLFIQIDLDEKLDDLFRNISRRARDEFNKEMNYLINTGFFYDIIKFNLEIEFNDTWDKYSNNLIEKKIIF